MLAALAVGRALAGDRDVLLSPRVDQRRVVHELHAFPACEHDGIAGRVGVELERRTGGDVKFDIAQQVDCAGEERSSWNVHASAARHRAFRDGFGDGTSGHRLAIGDCAVRGDVENAFRKSRRLHIAHDVGGTLPGVGRVGVRKLRQRHRGRERAGSTHERASIRHRHSPVRCSTISRRGALSRCSNK